MIDRLKLEGTTHALLPEQPGGKAQNKRRDQEAAHEAAAMELQGEQGRRRELHALLEVLAKQVQGERAMRRAASDPLASMKSIHQAIALLRCGDDRIGTSAT